MADMRRTMLGLLVHEDPSAASRYAARVLRDGATPDFIETLAEFLDAGRLVFTKTAKRGRPKNTSEIEIARKFFEFRERGEKYDVAAFLCSEMFGVSKSTVARAERKHRPDE